MGASEVLKIRKEIIILYAKSWEMVTETGQKRTGSSVWYIFDNFEDAVALGFGSSENKDGSTGMMPIKATLPSELTQEIIALGGAPVHASAEYGFTVKNNSPVLDLTGLTLIRPQEKKGAEKK